MSLKERNMCFLFAIAKNDKLFLLASLVIGSFFLVGLFRHGTTNSCQLASWLFSLFLTVHM